MFSNSNKNYWVILSAFTALAEIQILTELLISMVQCIDATSSQTVYDSDVRYIPKAISISIILRSTDNINLVSNRI